MYSPAQMDKLKTILHDYNHFCGYAYSEESEKGITSFFKYPEGEETQNLQGQGSEDESNFWTRNKGYLDLNKRTLSQIGIARDTVPNYKFGIEEVKGTRPPLFESPEDLIVKEKI